MRHALLWVGHGKRAAPESDIANRYLTRLRGFGQWEEHIVKPAPVSLGKEEQKRWEGRKIEALLQPGDWRVLCDETGRQLSSVAFANHMGRWCGAGHKRLVFVIGGAMGASDSLRQKAHFVLSLSKMTLPHALARSVLLEQIYRGFCIQSGHPYHHGG